MKNQLRATELSKLRNSLRVERERQRFEMLGLWNSQIGSEFWDMKNTVFYMKDGKPVYDRLHWLFSYICSLQTRHLQDRVPKALLYAHDYLICWDRMIIGHSAWRKGDPGYLVDALGSQHRLLPITDGTHILTDDEMTELFRFITSYDSVRHYEAHASR